MPRSNSVQKQNAPPPKITESKLKEKASLDTSQKINDLKISVLVTETTKNETNELEPPNESDFDKLMREAGFKNKKQMLRNLKKMSEEQL